jgi:hypothetical protein
MHGLLIYLLNGAVLAVVSVRVCVCACAGTPAGQCRASASSRRQRVETRLVVSTSSIGCRRWGVQGVVGEAAESRLRQVCSLFGCYRSEIGNARAAARTLHNSTLAPSKQRSLYVCVAGLDRNASLKRRT